MNEIEALALLGTNIKLYREKAGLTPQQLADMVGIDVSQLILLEAGNNPDIDMVAIFSITKALNVKMVQLVEQYERG